MSKSSLLGFIVLVISFITPVSRAAEIAPNNAALSDNLLLWLRTPDINYDETSGVWQDASGRDNHTNAVGMSEAGVDYAAGLLGSGSNAGIFAQEFSTVNFDATIDDMLIAEGINSGESLANLTIITVYSRTMVEGTNVSIIRPLGFGSWKLDNTADNFNLGTDPSIRKDNGNIGANSYSVPHPEDSTFFIRAARLHETSSVSEWFNVDGTLASTLTDTGAAYATGTDNFVIGDIRVDSSDTVTADLSIAEVIVYNRALEEEEIQGISEWLQTNIGVSASDEGGLAEVGLLGFWSFNEGEGSNVGDLSNNGRTAVVRNGAPEWGEGHTGGGLVLDGDDDLTVTGWHGISGNAPRSLAYWTKTDWDSSASSGIVGWGEATTGKKWHTRTNENAGNGVVGAVRTEIEGSFIIGTTPINDGAWHHIVSVFPEGGTLMGDVRHYVDGKLEVVSGMGSATVEVDTASEVSGTEVTFGSRLQGVNTQYYIGTIDDVAIWDRSLTEDEIAAIASGQEPLSGSAKDPVYLGPSTADFGQVTGFPLTHASSFEIRNLGRTKPLEITAATIVGGDDDHFTVDTFPANVAPGATAEVAFTFDSMGQSGGFQSTLELATNDADKPTVSIELSASIVNLQGPIGHYRLDEASVDDVLRDASGRDNPGAYVDGAGSVSLGAASLFGEEGTSAQFSGGGHARIPGSTIGGIEDFTITTWAQLDSTAGFQSIISKGDSPNFGLINNDGALAWFVDGDPGLTTDAILTAGTTVHLAVSYSKTDDTEGVVVLYVDGVQVARDEASAGVLDDDLGDLTLGITNESLPMSGSLDDVQVYNRPLSAEDIALLHGNPGQSLGDLIAVDSDGDGLSDEEEATRGTNALLVDTDGDGLEDGAEINDHLTDPVKVDSDGDRWPDGVELSLNLDPNDPESFGVIPALPPTAPESFNELMTLPTFNGNRDTEDVTFRVFIDFDPKPEGAREIIFESGGGTIGTSVVYEEPSTVVMRSSGSGGFALSTISYPLPQELLDGGEQQIIFTYDVEDPDGLSTISLFVGDALVGRVSKELGADWTGSDGASFGSASGSIAGTGNNTTLSGVGFTSGTINLETGLQFFADTLFDLLGDGDNDGLDDAWELSFFPDDLTELGPDTDNDNDGLNDLGEFTNGSDPTRTDSDGDGLSDGDEVNGATPSSPILVDTDDDRLTDSEEIALGSSPTNRDSDSDGFSDGYEVSQNTSPTDANSKPNDPLGEPTLIYTEVGASESLDSYSQQDASFRVGVDFDAKPEGDREMLYESGGGTVGISVVYEEGNKIVLRSAGNGGFTVITLEHSLTEAQLAAGALEVAWAFDVDNDNGGATVTLFLEGEEVASESSTEIGGDWSGTNEATFGMASTSFAAAGDNVALSDAVDFASGTIDLTAGLAFYSGKLLTGGEVVEPASFEITNIVRDAAGVTITWPAAEGATYAVDYSETLESASWSAIATGIGVGTYSDTDATRTVKSVGFYRIVQE